MRYARGVVMAVALALAGAAAQAPAPGTPIQAQLKSRLDSGHAKAGDRIKAQVTRAVKVNGAVVLPKGAQLLGRVTEVVKAESRKSPSRIGVLFTRATYKKRPAIAFRAGIARILSLPDDRPMDMSPPAMNMGLPAPPQPADNNDGSGMDGRMHPGTLGSEDVPSQATAAVPSAAGPRAPSLEVHIFVPTALASPAQQAAGSVLSSPHGDLKLASGARVELQVLH
jgi:hypothetical protein